MLYDDLNATGTEHGHGVEVSPERSGLSGKDYIVVGGENVSARTKSKALG